MHTVSISATRAYNNVWFFIGLLIRVAFLATSIVLELLSGYMTGEFLAMGAAIAYRPFLRATGYCLELIKFLSGPIAYSRMTRWTDFFGFAGMLAFCHATLCIFSIVVSIAYTNEFSDDIIIKYQSYQEKIAERNKKIKVAEKAIERFDDDDVNKVALRDLLDRGRDTPALKENARLQAKRDILVEAYNKSVNEPMPEKIQVGQINKIYINLADTLLKNMDDRKKAFSITRTLVNISICVLIDLSLFCAITLSGIAAFINKAFYACFWGENAGLELVSNWSRTGLEPVSNRSRDAETSWSRDLKDSSHDSSHKLMMGQESMHKYTPLSPSEACKTDDVKILNQNETSSRPVRDQFETSSSKPLSEDDVIYHKMLFLVKKTKMGNPSESCGLNFIVDNLSIGREKARSLIAKAVVEGFYEKQGQAYKPTMKIFKYYPGEHARAVGGN